MCAEPGAGSLTEPPVPSRWGGCTAPSPTSHATWSPARASCPSACRLSTASCSAASGCWRRKVGHGGQPQRGGQWGGARWHNLSAPPPFPAVHDSLSSVVTALTAERARLEDMQRALDRRRSAPRPGSAGPTGVRGAAGPGGAVLGSGGSGLGGAAPVLGVCCKSLWPRPNAGGLGDPAYTRTPLWDWGNVVGDLAQLSPSADPPAGPGATGWAAALPLALRFL